MLERSVNPHQTVHFGPMSRYRLCSLLQCLSLTACLRNALMFGFFDMSRSFNLAVELSKVSYNQEHSSTIAWRNWRNVAPGKPSRATHGSCRSH